MGYVFKNQIKRLFYFLIPSASRRTKRLKNKKFFYSMGDNVIFQPRKLPSDPKYIKIGNNVVVASDVSFVTHDVIHYVINNLKHNKDGGACSHLGCIEICDNVFVGSDSVILPNVRIGPNAVVAAGSVVTKDVPAGTIVAGCPAKVIGKFEDLVNKRLLESKTIFEKDRDKRVENEWLLFENQRKNSCD